MNNRTGGTILIAVAFFMMCGDIASDIIKLMNWCEITTPAFVGTTLAHFSAVGMAAIGGKLLPSPE